jgi:hypothetical protein
MVERAGVVQVESSEESKAEARKIVERLADKWQQEHGDHVPRRRFPKFSGGHYSPNYLANLDSKQCGIPGKFYIGRQACYPLAEAKQFLLDRIR